MVETIPQADGKWWRTAQVLVDEFDARVAAVRSYTNNKVAAYWGHCHMAELLLPEGHKQSGLDEPELLSAWLDEWEKLGWLVWWTQDDGLWWPSSYEPVSMERVHEWGELHGGWEPL